MRRTLPLLLAVALLSLVLAPPAMASLADRLLKDFADDGALDACKYTEQELNQIKGLIGNDIEAYQPDFRTAVDAMIEQRAQGACNKKSTASSSGAPGTAAPGSGGSAGSTPPGNGAPATRTPGSVQPAPAPVTPPVAAPLVATDAIAAEARAREDTSAPPFPVIGLAILGALMVLGGLLFAAVRFTGWEPAWAERARHAAAEAGWRASSTWSEFTDFVRFGR